ncbi:MAG: hypothetical protein Q8P60_13195 [Pseudorhodobacter sp.]|nr:hypothetical protein [Pseudorhodobacter sp.]
MVDDGGAGNGRSDDRGPGRAQPRGSISKTGAAAAVSSGVGGAWRCLARGMRKAGPSPEMQHEASRAAEIRARMCRNPAPWQDDQPTLRP